MRKRGVYFLYLFQVILTSQSSIIKYLEKLVELSHLSCARPIFSKNNYENVILCLKACIKNHILPNHSVRKQFLYNK